MNILFISAFVVLSPVVTAQIEVNISFIEMCSFQLIFFILKQPPFILGIRDVIVGAGAGHTEVELYKRNETKSIEDDEWIHVASK